MTKNPPRPAQPLSLLILGAGWTSTFLLPLLASHNISHAATSTTGRPGTLPFKYDPSVSPSSEEARTPFKSLPSASTILITFPLQGAEQTSAVLSLYAETHPHTRGVNWIQLGSSGIFQIEKQDCWVTRKSRYNHENARATAEDELLKRGGCVLNLAGLWGGERQPRNWVSRVAKTKEDVKGKASVHFVHGVDVARAIIAVLGNWESARGERWLITDMYVYDWWSLILGWAGNFEEGEKYGNWVRELMDEEDIEALPRSMEMLGRCYDTREFWQKFGIVPVGGRVGV